MKRAAFLLLALVATTAVGQAVQRPATSLGAGYLADAAPTDSLLLSPPPPAPGSPAEARDAEAARAALTLRGSARWDLATADAELRTPAATATMACAAGIALGPATTPRTDRLLRKVLADLGQSTSAIKERYQRPRPFVSNGAPICTPEAEAGLRQNGSYPSGHSAIGYGWGLILAELIPARANALVARGRAFGDSRRVCNVHWLSDVEEGRVAAAAVVARLHAVPAFQQDLKAARAELRRVAATPAACAAEAAALAQ